MILRHLQLANSNNEEFNKLLAGVAIVEGGLAVLLNIRAALLSKMMTEKLIEKPTKATILSRTAFSFVILKITDISPQV